MVECAERPAPEEEEEFWRKSAYGVWDWMKFFVVSGVVRERECERSETR